MYCQHCGTKIPDGGEFCPECGKRIGHIEATDSVPASSVTNKETHADNAAQGGKKGRISKGKKKIIAIASIVAVLLIAAIGICVLLGQPSERQGVHIPTVEEIEKKANSIEGGTFSIEPNASFEDAFDIYVDGNLAGSMYLKAYQPKCIGVYIQGSQADDASLVFAQFCVGVIEACDPSLGLDGAKEIANQIASNSITGNPVECNGVTYTPKFSANEYELDITVPDERVVSDE